MTLVERFKNNNFSVNKFLYSFYNSNNFYIVFVEAGRNITVRKECLEIICLSSPSAEIGFAFRSFRIKILSTI